MSPEFLENFTKIEIFEYFLHLPFSQIKEYIKKYQLDEDYRYKSWNESYSSKMNQKVKIINRLTTLGIRNNKDYIQKHNIKN